MAPKSQRAKNQTFPYSEAKRVAILARFKPGQRVHATITRHGKDTFAAGKITRMARTGWMYVKLDGRKSPTKVDPTKWQSGEGHPPKTTAPAAKKKPATAKPTVRKKVKTAKKAAVARKRRKIVTAAPEEKRMAIVGGSTMDVADAPESTVTAVESPSTETAPTKPKRVRNRKKTAAAVATAPAPATAAEEETVPVKRTPVHVEEPAPAGDAELA